MSSHVGQYVKRARESRKLNRAQVAKAMGRRNINKAMRKIMDVEANGPGDPEFFRRLAEVLALDDGELRRRAEQDWREYQAWLDEPVPMYLVVRMIAGFYAEAPLPAEVADDPVAAEECACWVARKYRCKVCLVVSRRLSVFIEKDGQVSERSRITTSEPNIPYMQIKGRKFLPRLGEAG